MQYNNNEYVILGYKGSDVRECWIHMPFYPPADRIAYSIWAAANPKKDIKDYYEWSKKICEELSGGILG
jgi:hypothetical protein